MGRSLSLSGPCWHSCQEFQLPFSVFCSDFAAALYSRNVKHVTEQQQRERERARFAAV